MDFASVDQQTIVKSFTHSDSLPPHTLELRIDRGGSSTQIVEHDTGSSSAFQPPDSLRQLQGQGCTEYGALFHRSLWRLLVMSGPTREAPFSKPALLFGKLEETLISKSEDFARESAPHVRLITDSEELRPLLENAWGVA